MNALQEYEEQLRSYGLPVESCINDASLVQANILPAGHTVNIAYIFSQNLYLPSEGVSSFFPTGICNQKLCKIKDYPVRVV